MTVPLMIWSARTVIDSQAWRSDTSMPDGDRRDDADEERDVAPKIGAGVDRSHRLGDEAPTRKPANAAAQHHPLDADVHDARALAHDAAQRAERDRGRQRDDDRRRCSGTVVDEVAEQLDDDAEDRERYEEARRSGPISAARPPYELVTVCSSADRRRARAGSGTTPADDDVGGQEEQDHAWMTSMISTGIRPAICIRPAPARIAPNSSAANTIADRVRPAEQRDGDRVEADRWSRTRRS